MSTSTTGADTVPDLERGQTRNLALATLAFVISFWAWNIIGPLGVRYAGPMDLSAGEKSLLVSIPVLVGSLGRILTGALTDRFGGRVMFTVLLLATAPFVLLVAFAGNRDSYGLMLLFGFFLGIGGTTFAVGIPFVNAWFTADRRGFATGVFGAGMGGTALSAFFTARFVNWFGYTTTHVIIAAALVVVALIVWTMMRDSPAWRPNTDPVVPKLAAAMKLPITWQMSFLYAIAFGGFVAFSTYLPKYLTTIYPQQVDQIGAGTRLASFVVAAVIARPIGGVLADRLGAKLVTAVSLGGIAVLAWVVSLQPPEGVLTGATFLAMAAALGVGMGAIFGWVPRLAPSDKVGSVSGVVAAAGGLGGYFPPLVMGATYDKLSNSYALGLWLLVLTAALALVLALVLRGRKERAPA